MSTIHKLELDYCPNCDNSLNAAHVIGDNEDEAPKVGDVTICIECTSYLMFDEHMKLRECTVDEICDMDNDTLLELTRARNYFKNEKIRRQHVFDKVKTIFGIVEEGEEGEKDE